LSVALCATQVPTAESAASAPGLNRERGEVFTRRWVVDLILDLVGYTPKADLAGKAIVEPSCGTGAFMIPIVERLAASCAVHGRSLADQHNAIRGFEVLAHHAENARQAVARKLSELGEPVDVAERLARCWVTEADFLLSDHEGETADFVVGNPPYVRLEDIPDDANVAYRSACPTMWARSDLFVGFFERGLRMLAPDGRLGFICADRWMHNHYGARLRELIGDQYAVESVIEMHDADAFEAYVSAYPAIVVLRNSPQQEVKLASTTDRLDERVSRRLRTWLSSPSATTHSDDVFEASILPGWFSGSGQWPTGSPEVLGLVSDLESRFAPLEDLDTGTRVGIGLATGCDDVFITDEPRGIEQSRLLPLATTADVASGQLRWSGRYLVNPWDDGSLVDLDDYPGLASHLRLHEHRVRNRHVARRRPETWYRTIDKVKPGLLETPKLLMPDIKSAAHPVLDRGEYYPHHNLYYIVSDKWDLEVLGGLLLSDFANLIVGAYCTKMRNGGYRFQAQYLRKIRVPAPDAIDVWTASALTEAFRHRDRTGATAAAAKCYGISDHEVAAAA